MKYKRSSGILLHPTSLPGPYGIGDIGPAAHRWLEFLDAAGCALWQVLPLGPTGYADSPYQCFSAFAGNPYLISPEVLVEDGLLLEEDLRYHPPFPEHRVDFGTLIPWKLGLLDVAYQRFYANGKPELKQDMALFRVSQAAWLEDFALFMAIKEAQGGGSWSNWPEELRLRKPEALAQARLELASAIERHVFRQFIFFRQWGALQAKARQLGITIIGDIPIFVAHDSADVWANLELFHMDEEGQPTLVAGVPPDYFSPTGQLWGNPLYRWDAHRETGYQWWIERFKAVRQMVDIVRLDHFRGFAGYWEIPYGSPTAETGQWVPGPGKEFMEAIERALGGLPIIAEDLGVITPDVVELRDTFRLPGMRILLFGFGFGIGPDDPYLPHNFKRNSVAYTGTHDNEPILAWYRTATEDQRKFCQQYLDLEPNEQHLAWKMVRAVWSSVAMFSLAPMQDVLELGAEARMNFPGTPSGNWTWRMRGEDLSTDLCHRLERMNFFFSRKK